jgi:hypothetical protein
MEAAAVKFEHPYVLLAIAFVVVLGPLLYVWAGQRARRRLVGLVAPRLAEQMVRSVDFAKRRWKAVIFGLGLCALCVALARPNTVSSPRKSNAPRSISHRARSFSFDARRGREWEDASRCVVGSDCAAAQRAWQRTRGIDRFAGEAFLAAPITQDHASVRRNLEALGTESVARAGSDIAARSHSRRNFRDRKF